MNITSTHPNNEKPLPSLPILSLPGCAHFRRLLQSNLAEQGFSTLNGIQEWAITIEGALDDLMQKTQDGRSSHDWLAGILKARLKREARYVGIVTPSESGSSAVTEAALPDLPALTRLQQLRELIMNPSASEEKHLLLCVSTDATNGSIACNFVVNDYTPIMIAKDLEDDEACIRNLLFDLLDSKTLSANPVLIGGCFTFQGAPPDRRDALVKVLRLAVYTYTSLVIEQQFLADSQVVLEFAKPPSPLPTTNAVTHVTPHVTSFPFTTKGKHKTRHSVFSIHPGGILAYFSKKTESLLHRTTSMRQQNPMVSRTLTPASQITPKAENDNQATTSPSIFRAFSLAIDSRNTVKEAGDSSTLKSNVASFSNVLVKLRNASHTLSTSPDVSFDPPMLLHKLGDEEMEKGGSLGDRQIIIRGDDKAGLGSIIGWNGRRDQARGMTQSTGFIRHQEISILESHHVKLDTDDDKDCYGPCGRPQVIRYRYYSRKHDDRNREECLGSAIRRFCQRAEEDCELDTNCLLNQGAHETRMCHNGLRAVFNVHPHESLDEQAVDPEDEQIRCWMSCSVCKEVSNRSLLSAGAQLLSFGKFLELLFYSRKIHVLTPELCEHTAPPPDPPDQAGSASLSNSRLNILRHFEYRKHRVSIRLSVVDDILELRVPALQIAKQRGSRGSRTTKQLETIVDLTVNLDKQNLKREIKVWWEGLTDHIDILELVFPTDTPRFTKALPRLPSIDDVMSEGDDEDISTPKTHVIPLPSASEEILDSEMLSVGESNSTAKSLESSSLIGTLRRTVSSPAVPSQISIVPVQPMSAHDHLQIEKDDQASVQATTKEDKALSNDYADSLRRLTVLRHHFQGVEQNLYALLATTPHSSLNDVRATFHSAARGATRRLQAWQRKHVPKPPKNGPNLTVMKIEEPSWWSKSCHTIPGSSILVRDDDWGSIIAFTIGSLEYQNELAGMSTLRSGTANTTSTSSVPPTPAAIIETSSSFFSGGAYKLFSSTPKPDPDDENLIWHEPETFSSIISRKEHPRDQASLLTLSRTTKSTGLSNTMEGPSKIGTGGSTLHNVSNESPASTAKKTDTEAVVSPGVHNLEIEGQNSEKLLEDKLDSFSSSMTSSAVSEASDDEFIDTHIRRANASSVDSTDSDSTVGPEDETDAPAPPPKDEDTDTSTKSGFTSTVTSTITSAMRYVLSTSDGTTAPPIPVTFTNRYRRHTDSSERPHIKYDWVIGKRMKFSCTVYFAEQFDALRRRCGIEEVFIPSIAKSANWNAEGGKSKSNFWKTHDSRFIIKTLVNAWNVADLQVLLDLAPAYFKYIDSTAGEATVLAKLVGFYTIQIKNLENNSTHAKADVLVMENLFHNKNINKTYDFKGIQGRRLKINNTADSGSKGTSKTLFDGDWVDSQARTLVLVQPHSKAALKAALKNDTDFLTKSNIMDYSLLVGIDNIQKQISCGLVDTVGSYTFAKTLEYKAKQGLTSHGKEVTVMPPVEYQDRFMTALDRYILPCPDKWTKSSNAKSTLMVNDVLW